MGLDARDCRLDIAFVLGDRNVPDNVTWSDSLRDKTCVWLDFVDAQFSPCRTVDEYISDEVRNIDSELTDNTVVLGDSEEIYMTANIEPVQISYTDIPTPVISVCSKSNSISTSDINVNPFTVCISSDKISVTPTEKKINTCLSSNKVSCTNLNDNKKLRGRV